LVHGRAWGIMVMVPFLLRGRDCVFLPYPTSKPARPLALRLFLLRREHRHRSRVALAATEVGSPNCPPAEPPVASRRRERNWPRPHVAPIGPGLFCTSVGFLAARRSNAPRTPCAHGSGRSLTKIAAERGEHRRSNFPDYHLENGAEVVPIRGAGKQYGSVELALFSQRSARYRQTQYRGD